MWPSGLRRVTRNHFSSGGVGSNPAAVVLIRKRKEKEKKKKRKSKRKEKEKEREVKAV